MSGLRLFGISVAVAFCLSAFFGWSLTAPGRCFFYPTGLMVVALCAGFGALIAKLSKDWPIPSDTRMEFSTTNIAAMIAFMSMWFMPLVMFPPASLGWKAGTWIATTPYSHPGEHCPVLISPQKIHEINNFLDEVEGGQRHYISPHLLAR